MKSYIKLLGKKNITETINNKVISSEIFKNFMNAIVNGVASNNNIKEKYNKYLSDIEKNLAKSKCNKNVDKFKKYLIKIKNLVNKNDKKKLQSTDTSRQKYDTSREEYDTSREEYDTDMPPLETEEEAAENIANIYERRDDTRNKEKSDFNGYDIDINCLNRDGYNINGVDITGLNRDGYNVNGVDRNGVDRNSLNINGIEGTIKKYPKRKVKLER